MARELVPTLTQITDAFADFLHAYESLWSKAKVEHPCWRRLTRRSASLLMQ
jgi:hypothetical protein